MLLPQLLNTNHWIIGSLQVAIHVVQNRRAGEQKTYIILNCNFLCLSCPSATFAHQHGGFAPRDWLPAKSLYHSRAPIGLAIKVYEPS